MKNLFLSLTLLVAFMLPSFGQVDHDYSPNDRIPIVNAKISQDQVPAAVLKAFNTKFDKNNPATWSKFPYALKEYGWVYDVGAAEIPLDRYEVKVKTADGKDFWAVYNAEGQLIQTDEISKDIPIPNDIMVAFSKSQYKDWEIVGNREIIRYYHDHNDTFVEQHFRLTVQKDNEKRSISFNYNSRKDK